MSESSTTTTNQHRSAVSPDSPLIEQAQNMNLRGVRRWETRRKTGSRELGSGIPRILRRGINEVEHICHSRALDLPEPVCRSAIAIFRRALDKDLVRNRPTEAVAGAAVCAATRQANLPYQLCEIETHTRIETPLSGAFRYIQRELGLAIQPPTVGPFVDRFVDELGLDQDTKDRAYGLLQHEDNQTVMIGRNPASLAASAIYAVSLQTDEPLTQDEIVAVTAVGETSLRQRYQELLDIDGEI